MIDSPENTMRILKDQNPIQKLRCRWGFHRWTTWEVVDRSHEYVAPIAKCTCADCGMPRIERPYSKTQK